MTSPVVLALDFGGTKTAAAVAEPGGARLGTATVSATADSGARANLTRAVDAARDLLHRVAPARRLCAVGVATFGIPGPDGVALAPAIDGWDTLALDRELAAAFDGVPVRVATDVKAAARVEAATGALAGCDPGVYLNLGTGLAVALVTGGVVLNGRHGASGEIGYNLRAVADVGRDLADRLMLEQAVSGGALLAAARRAEPRLTDAAAVFTAAPYHPELRRVLDDFLDELSFHVVNLAVAVDPQRIAVGGGMVRSWDRIAPRLRAALDAAVPFPPDLVPAAYPYDAPLIGALMLATEAAGERPGGAVPVTAPSDMSPRPAPPPAPVKKGL